MHGAGTNVAGGKGKACDEEEGKSLAGASKHAHFAAAAAAAAEAKPGANRVLVAKAIFEGLSLFLCNLSLCFLLSQLRSGLKELLGVAQLSQLLTAGPKLSPRFLEQGTRLPAESVVQQP
jgi:hypothetical protein